MTIAHRAERVEGKVQPAQYQCDVCHKVDVWGPEWSKYSSLDLDETCPGDVPTACSDACAQTMLDNIRSGKWKLPKLQSNGHYSNVIAERRGY